MQPAQGKQLGAPIIECLDVHKWFGTFHVLRGCSLTVQEKEVVVIIGPSGSGKSTFIRCMNRLETHQRGTIRVNGVALTDDEGHKAHQHSFLRIHGTSVCKRFSLKFSRTARRQQELSPRQTGY